MAALEDNLTRLNSGDLEDYQLPQNELITLEKGDEWGWQTKMEEIPDYHQLREQFGDWLIAKGDKRGPGYRALGQLQIHARKKAGAGTKVSSKWEYWELTNSNNSYYWNEIYTLPLLWFKAVDLTDAESPSWVMGCSSKSLHDRVALAFNKLTESQREEVLQQGTRLYRFEVSKEVLPELVFKMKGADPQSPFSGAVVRQRLLRKKNPVKILVTEIPEQPFAQWCKEHGIEFTSEPLRELGSVKSVCLSEDWEGRRQRTKSDSVVEQK